MHRLQYVAVSILTTELARLAAAETSVCTKPFAFAAHGALTSRLKTLTSAYSYEQHPYPYVGEYAVTYRPTLTRVTFDDNYDKKTYTSVSDVARYL